MVLRSGKRREEEEFQNIDGQLALDDPNVTQDRLLRIGWKAEDVAAPRINATLVPRLKHGAVLGDLVLLLVSREQIVRVDILQPNEDTLHAGAHGLFDEVRNLVAKGVDLNGEVRAEAFRLAQ